VQVKKTVTDIKASVSCDQLVANQIGKQTRFPSLEVGLEDARQAGDCVSATRARTQTTWRGGTRPGRCLTVLVPRAPLRAAVRRRRGARARSTRETPVWNAAAC
jgi:hypothetical protein